MVRSTTDATSRRRVLKMCAASGATALGGASLGTARRESTNELHLVEVGATFAPADGTLSVELRMPVDSPPKYRTADDRLVPSPFTDEVERRRLRSSTAAVSDGRVRPVGTTLGGPSAHTHLPLELWNGRQPVDVARVGETVEIPRYTVRIEGADAVVTAAGSSATVANGDSSLLTFPPVTYSVLEFTRVEAGETMTEEGLEPRYQYEERVHERTFVPRLRVHNRGTVAVLAGEGVQ